MRTVEIEMSLDNPSVGAAYAKYYKSQTGSGEIIVYRRNRAHQNGDGIGDILRGLARFLLPLFFRGAKTFANETIRGTEQGMSFGEAAKGALHPTLNAVTGAATKQFQGGSGKKRKSKQNGGSNKRAKRQKTKRAKKNKVKAKRGKGVFKGDTIMKRLQTGGKKSRKIKRSKKITRGKKISKSKREINSNFEQGLNF
jgi:hypothetical protein